MDISHTTPHRAIAARTPIRLAVLGLEVIGEMADAEMVGEALRGTHLSARNP